MNTSEQKHGIAINEVTGQGHWFLVEYADGSATIHETREEAMTAGNFDTDK